MRGQPAPAANENFTADDRSSGSSKKASLTAGPDIKGSAKPTPNTAAIRSHGSKYAAKHSATCEAAYIALQMPHWSGVALRYKYIPPALMQSGQSLYGK